ncbi:MAG TPA: hypothetical protein PK639_00415 [Candidatus Woesebacteria bacterium]|nr:hypothetical protein [Candidatus Woesebacteria bacterium]
MEKRSNLPKLFIIFLIFPFLVYFISFLLVRRESPSTYRFATPTLIPSPAVVCKPNTLQLGHLSIIDISDPKNIIEPTGIKVDSPLRSITVNNQKYQFSREYYSEILPTSVPGKQNCYSGSGYYKDSVDVANLKFEITQAITIKYCGQEKQKIESNLSTTSIESLIKTIESLASQL